MARRQKMTFAVDPWSSIGTSAHPDLVSRARTTRASVLQWLRAMVNDGCRAGVLNASSFAVRVLRRGLATPVIAQLFSVLLVCLLLLTALRNYIFRRHVTCPMVPLSAIIRRAGLNTTRIKLVKIDVEGAELEVVNGLSDEHLANISQIVIEVHHVDNHIELIQQRLQRAGFTVLIDQEDWELFPFLNIYTIFAVRDPAPAIRELAQMTSITRPACKVSS